MGTKQIKLSILICTLPNRVGYFNRLKQQLAPQIAPYLGEIEVLRLIDPAITVGAKRNVLLRQAKGVYVCFIDDDDRISPDYVSHIMNGINKYVDCCSLTGLLTEPGGEPKKFIHSIKYSAYAENEDHYERYPNHLNTIRADIAKQFTFPDKNFGEDTEWATQLHISGMLKIEHYIEPIIYYYDYIRNK